jgi:hypothetical protein
MTISERTRRECACTPTRWVILLTDRRDAGAILWALVRIRDGAVVKTKGLRRAKRFRTEALARRWARRSLPAAVRRRWLATPCEFPLADLVRQRETPKQPVLGREGS